MPKMNDLGLELLKLVDERAVRDRETHEILRKQLPRFVGKLEKTRSRFGKNLENLAKDLRKRISRKGLPGQVIKIFLPWRRYADIRQLELVEVLISWHEAESREFVQVMTSLATRWDSGSTSGKSKE
jgi:hypothetical protein